MVLSHLIMQNGVCAPQLMLICISYVWLPQEGSVFLMFEVYIALSVNLCQMNNLISFLYGGWSVTNKQCFVYIVTGNRNASEYK